MSIEGGGGQHQYRTVIREVPGPTVYVDRETIRMVEGPTITKVETVTVIKEVFPRRYKILLGVLVGLVIALALSHSHAQVGGTQGINGGVAGVKLFLAQTWTKIQTFSAGTVAPIYALTSITAGPQFNYFDEMLNPGSTWQLVSVGSPSGDTQGNSITGADANHIGIMTVYSGTGGTGTGGTSITVAAGPALYNEQTSVFTYETSVKVSVLPLTTAGTYQAGFSGNGYQSTPWGSNSLGFELSSANSGFTSANDWACMYGSTLVDSGVLASSSAFQRLDLVNNGTNAYWYINGTQVCTVASSSLPSTSSPLALGSVAGSGTGVYLYSDYVSLTAPLTR